MKSISSSSSSSITRIREKSTVGTGEGDDGMIEEVSVLNNDLDAADISNNEKSLKPKRTQKTMNFQQQQLYEFQIRQQKRQSRSRNRKKLRTSDLSKAIDVSHTKQTELIDGFYEVEEILKIKNLGKYELRFLIKWKGWSDEDNTWEPYQNVRTCYGCLKEFYENSSTKKSVVNSDAWQLFLGCLKKDNLINDSGVFILELKRKYTKRNKDNGIESFFKGQNRENAEANSLTAVEKQKLIRKQKRDRKKLEKLKGFVEIKSDDLKVKIEESEDGLCSSTSKLNKYCSTPSTSAFTMCDTNFPISGGLSTQMLTEENLEAPFQQRLDTLQGDLNNGLDVTDENQLQKQSSRQSTFLTKLTSVTERDANKGVGEIEEEIGEQEKTSETQKEQVSNGVYKNVQEYIDTVESGKVLLCNYNDNQGRIGGSSRSLKQIIENHPSVKSEKEVLEEAEKLKKVQQGVAFDGINQNNENNGGGCCSAINDDDKSAIALFTGNLKLKDEPIRILAVDIHPFQKGKFIFEVSWAPRKKKEQLLSSWVEGDVLKNKFPYLVLEFYESFVRFQG